MIFNPPKYASFSHYNIPMSVRNHTNIHRLCVLPSSPDYEFLVEWSQIQTHEPQASPSTGSGTTNAARPAPGHRPRKRRLRLQYRHPHVPAARERLRHLPRQPKRSDLRRTHLRSSKKCGSARSNEFSWHDFGDALPGVTVGIAITQSASPATDCASFQLRFRYGIPTTRPPNPSLNLESSRTAKTMTRDSQYQSDNMCTALDDLVVDSFVEVESMGDGLPSSYER